VVASLHYLTVTFCFLQNVMQFYRVAESDEGKFDALHGLKDAINSHSTIIYASNSLKVDWLFDKIASMGCSVAHTHELCDKNMREFRSGAIRVVVVSLAYPVDVAQVSLVIHFDLPCSGDHYVRSISRAGQLGHRGRPARVEGAAHVLSPAHRGHARKRGRLDLKRQLLQRCRECRLLQWRHQLWQ
jgi:superfamily II DNA/RNA helicase